MVTQHELVGPLDSQAPLWQGMHEAPEVEQMVSFIFEHFSGLLLKTTHGMARRSFRRFTKVSAIEMKMEHDC